ncbi:unnamed protein product, partial [Acanthoscelides obtectus]
AVENIEENEDVKCCFQRDLFLSKRVVCLDRAEDPPKWSLASVQQYPELIEFVKMYLSPSAKRPTLDRMFASTSQRNDDGLRASYNISLLIAKSGKPHTIGEKLILPAVEEVLKTDLHKPASDIIKRIPLSNNTVERRIDKMSSDIESFLYRYKT